MLDPVEHAYQGPAVSHASRKSVCSTLKVLFTVVDVSEDRFARNISYTSCRLT